MLKMAFSGTHQLTSLPWYAVVEMVSEKHCRVVTTKKARPAFNRQEQSSIVSVKKI